MSSPSAVAQTALIDSQTLALIGDDIASLEALLSALNHIASGGKREAKRWAGLRKEAD